MRSIAQMFRDEELAKWLGMQDVSLVFWLGSISAAAADYSSPP